ncbi:Uncharacterized membrane protein [Seinonella peptonophila]|uniref:Uncharacterized membrane protein n=1 Tax=Seinonella peptonophila TaxID=112248 RepID=A0A1M4T610_9BACL|nr:anthrone oxygenase family protein [Seinonella peptonophila]SHE39757.1 Uncharacterized membrane protein [Seinonella peptonophila]
MTGLVSGLFYGFAVSVNPGFYQLSDIEYIHAMQAINTAILNPIFFISFIGAVVFLPVAAFMYKKQSKHTFKWLITASILYIVGVFGVTTALNVPLNDQLAGFSIKSSSIHQIGAMRTSYADAWNRWHLVRTVLSIISFVLSIIAMFSLRKVKLIEKIEE